MGRLVQSNAAKPTICGCQLPPRSSRAALAGRHRIARKHTRRAVLPKSSWLISGQVKSRTSKSKKTRGRKTPGEPKRRRIVWTPEQDALLGKLADWEVAQRLGRKLS